MSMTVPNARAVRSTVRLGRDGEDEFLSVSEVYFPPPLKRSRDLPVAFQLQNGRVLRIRLSPAHLAALLVQLSLLGIRPPA